METIAQAIGIGIFSSFLASLMYLSFLSLLRPKILISPKISKSESGNYVIKVINKSKRDAVDIQAELCLLTPINVPKGQIWKRQKIPLNTSKLMVLRKFDTKDKDAIYAFRFTTKVNLEEIWNDKHSYLRFRLFAKDEVSGFGKVFEQKYYTKSDIIQGSFAFGDSFDIN